MGSRPDLACGETRRETHVEDTFRRQLSAKSTIHLDGHCAARQATDQVGSISCWISADADPKLRTLLTSPP